MRIDRQDTFADKLIPYYFVAFFVGLAILFGWFVHLARSSYTGLVTDQAYEKGVAYNSTIAQAAAQDEMGWQGKIAYADNTVTFVLTDAAGAAIDGATVSLWLFRPVQEAMDVHVPMISAGAGVYTAAVDQAARGYWEARILAKTLTAEYQTSKKVVFE